jgi:hypothetical protein
VGSGLPLFVAGAAAVVLLREHQRDGESADAFEADDLDGLHCGFDANAIGVVTKAVRDDQHLRQHAGVFLDQVGEFHDGNIVILLRKRVHQPDDFRHGVELTGLERGGGTLNGLFG